MRGSVRLDSVKVEWREGASNQVSCQATAEVSYPLANGDRRLEWLTSGGLHGIDLSGPDDPYKAEVASEELNDLRAHLARFGVRVSGKRWRELTSGSL